MASRDGYIGVKDFPGQVIRAYEDAGWTFVGRAFVQKNPQAQAIRTKSKALERVLELIEENVKGKSPIRLATLHANAPEEAKIILKKAEQELNPVESIFSEISAVVANHAGPGTVGLAYMAGM